MADIGYGIPWRVDGPPPIQSKFGLLQAAAAPAAGVRIVVDLDGGPVDEAEFRALVEAGSLSANAGQERWLNGVQVFPYPPGNAFVWDACAPGSERVEKEDGADTDLPRFGAFVVYNPVTCTSYRVWDQDEYKARAMLVFTVVEGASVENELQTGAILGTNPHLADGNGDFPIGDTVTSPVNGLALLEDEIARSNRFGIIHMSPGLATVLRNYHIIDDRTGVLRTINGTVVIPGQGYVDGPAPPGHAVPATGQEWVYATGPIDIRRSDPFITPEDVSQALDRGIGGMSNSITYRAERYYLVDWDTTLQAAVLVDRCQVEC